MNHECGLCRTPGAVPRAGRLGRYALTCDRCEAARGSHLDESEARERRRAMAAATLARRTGLANRQPAGA